jgi:hypothetical protein
LYYICDVFYFCGKLLFMVKTQMGAGLSAKAEGYFFCCRLNLNGIIIQLRSFPNFSLHKINKFIQPNYFESYYKRIKYIIDNVKRKLTLKVFRIQTVFFLVPLSLLNFSALPLKCLKTRLQNTLYNSSLKVFIPVNILMKRILAN